MSDIIRISAPLDAETARSLRTGQRVLLSGVIYTARDAAHRRLCELLDAGGEPPFPLEGAVIYYCGPAAAPPGRPIGAAGPTTSYRMDAYAPRLIERGVRGMIGKGERSAAVAEAMRGHGAVYLAATGGAGALLAGCVVECEVIAWDDLGAEAVRRLTVRDMPLTCAQDAAGGDLYRSGPEDYIRTVFGCNCLRPARREEDAGT